MSLVFFFNIKKIANGFENQELKMIGKERGK
jgi:hypothetical protein